MKGCLNSFPIGIDKSMHLVNLMHQPSQFNTEHTFSALQRQLWFS